MEMPAPINFTDKPYVIGIDLGTTNCSVSYVDTRIFREDAALSAKERQAQIKVFSVPQLTGQGEFSRLQVLPSFLYIPGEYDISAQALVHPWKKREDLFVGSFARDHGSKIPARLVSSAKSWMCNPDVDRLSKILPWGASGVEKVSPVEAAAQYLLHIRSAWNHSVKDEDLFLENQFVVITVPASFNEQARDLTAKAIDMAGLGTSVTLLEEPLAAFYAWLIYHEDDWKQHISEDELILVCDMGGGTTDFSLISLKAQQGGSPRFERIAVGDHLILGGDNIDLALARVVESRFKGKNVMSADQWKTLCHRCREAKESILERGEETVRITLKGQGRSLISGTLAGDLTRDDVMSVLWGQFFAAENQNHSVGQRQDMADFGLPFEGRTNVMGHITEFLEAHSAEIQQVLGKSRPAPDWILFNGGSLKPNTIQSRIVDLIASYFQLSDGKRPKILENPSADLSVSMGASYYGLVKQGMGVRVGSGSPRSYYLGVASGQANQAVCLVERGLDEGSSIQLPRAEYQVRANEPVSFPVYSSSFRSGDRVGDMVDIDDSLIPMPPLQTIIRFGKGDEKKIIPIQLGADYTEMGTLAMYCRSQSSDHQWVLQFQLRNSEPPLETADTRVYEQEMIASACALLREGFSSADAKDVAGLVSKIEKLVGEKKFQWPLSFLRSLVDELISLAPERSKSADHEARWLNLVGFCARPGFGDGFDQDRIQKLWKIYMMGLQFPKAKQNRLEWWIFVRRIAGGFKAGHQRQIFQEVSQILIKQKTNLPPQEMAELWMAAGNMERLLVKDKIALASALIRILGKARQNTATLLWVLGRLGGRQMLYGSLDRVVPPTQAQAWIRKVMALKEKNIQILHDPVVQMARMVGDRTRDIDSEEQEKILDWLRISGAKQGHIKSVAEKVQTDQKQQNVQFGERLPVGLILE